MVLSRTSSSAKEPMKTSILVCTRGPKCIFCFAVLQRLFLHIKSRTNRENVLMCIRVNNTVDQPVLLLGELFTDQREAEREALNQHLSQEAKSLFTAQLQI